MFLHNRRRNCGTIRAHLWRLAAAILILLCAGGYFSAVYGAGTATEPDVSMQRRQLYEVISLKAGLNWQLIAAIDQYERTLSLAHPETRPVRKDALTGIYVADTAWSGVLKSREKRTDPASIRFFQGVGRDGSGDGARMKISGKHIFLSEHLGQQPKLGRIPNPLRNGHFRGLRGTCPQHLLRRYRSEGLELFWGVANGNKGYK